MMTRWAVAGFLLLFAVSWWDAPYPAEQALHHSLTVIALVALWFAARRFRLAQSSILLILSFLAVHTIAARWIYSYVPYDQWAQAISGHTISELFGWERNNFDRLVHVAYGLFFAPVLMRYVGWIRAVEIIVATSALYELFEWLIAVMLSPGAAEAYNGQQGDMWDAHKDIACATVGALISIALVRRGSCRFKRIWTTSKTRQD